MIRESGFQQKEIYTNRVWISSQNRRICEQNLDMEELFEICPKCEVIGRN
jgi:hypothetical protein